MARPTAVEVKLLLSEYSACGESASYGDHQPSATTWPWRTSMKLFIDSMFLSAASMNARMRKTKCPGFGMLRGNGSRRRTASQYQRPGQQKTEFS